MNGPSQCNYCDHGHGCDYISGTMSSEIPRTTSQSMDVRSTESETELDSSLQEDTDRSNYIRQVLSTKTRDQKIQRIEYIKRRIRFINTLITENNNTLLEYQVSPSTKPGHINIQDMLTEIMYMEQDIDECYEEMSLICTSFEDGIDECEVYNITI